MKIAINTKIDFKPDSDDKASFYLLATGFENCDLSILEIARLLELGYVICAQHKGRRKKDNFIQSSAIPVDIDWGMRSEDILNHPFVKKYGGIFYPTWSSTEKHNRSRVIFFCIDPITDAATMEKALTGGIRLLGGDASCRDACRMFYGNKNATPIVLGNVLSEEALNELIAIGTDKEPAAEKVSKGYEKSSSFTAQSSEELEEHQSVKTISGTVEKLSDLEKGVGLYCPVHEDKNPSAFVTVSRHGINGVHCSTCAKTFWPKSENCKSRKYDFNVIDAYLNYAEFIEGPDHQFHDKKHEEFFHDDDRVIQPRNASRLGKITLKNGIVLVQSPMGTGKTYETQGVFQECKAKNLSVLLIGHRRTLISSLAARIGLDCYLDEEGNKVAPSRHYAICVDSIPRMIDLHAVHYDVIIIDESEQVFSHFTSDTLKKNRRLAFSKMQHLIKKARTVIACDADLNYLTLCSLSGARNGETPTTVYVNRYQHPNRSIEIYESENHLLSGLVNSIKRGEKSFVCSNSKERVEEFAQVISNSVGQECRVMVVTSDTTTSENVKNFIKNVSGEILLYDVTISSPSLGTGIDISFPEDRQMIDGVYGFFDANITTHFDVAQQLGRVRNPKYVKVWLSPRSLNLPIDPEEIKREVVEKGEFTEITVDYDENGSLIFDSNDRLLSLFAEVRSIQNASKNNLRNNFIDHQSYRGCEVTKVGKDDDAAKTGAALRREAKGDIKKSRSQDILDAENIMHSEARRIDDFNSNDPFERAKLEKFLMEKFYGQAVTEDLIALDAAGKYRHKIKLLSRYIEYVSNLPMLNEKDSNPDNEKLTLIFKLLQLAKLLDDSGNFIDGKIIDNRDLTEFKAMGISEIKRIKELLGISVRQDIDTKPMNLLGDILSNMGLRWNKTFKKVIDTRSVTYYSIDFSRYQWAKRVAENFLKQEQSWGGRFITNL